MITPWTLNSFLGGDAEGPGGGGGTRPENWWGCAAGRWKLDLKRSRKKLNLGPKRSIFVKIGSFCTPKDSFAVGGWEKVPQKDRARSCQSEKRGSKPRHICITHHIGSTPPGAEGSWYIHSSGWDGDGDRECCSTRASSLECPLDGEPCSTCTSMGTSAGELCSDPCSYWPRDGEWSSTRSLLFTARWPLPEGTTRELSWTRRYWPPARTAQSCRWALSLITPTVNVGLRRHTDRWVRLLAHFRDFLLTTASWVASAASHISAVQFMQNWQWTNWEHLWALPKRQNWLDWIGFI